MKTVYTTTLMITVVLMLLIPLCAARRVPAADKTEQVLSGQVAKGQDRVKVMEKETGSIAEYSLNDYLFGVVSAEMPALYENEALKAQAVAAYTYLLCKTESNVAEDYDITDDYTVDQAFITPEKAREKWENSADEYENKIRSAIDAVLYKKITYDGRPISAVYHAISGGKTENASDIWGGEYPYLVSVDSSFDKLAENYLSTATFTAEELKNALSSVAELVDTGSDCFSDIKRTASGSVMTLSVSGQTVKGSEIRKILGLKSADFDVVFVEGTYTFTVRGYGHGIGMSQNGANYMAMQGKTYEEILKHYYSGCQIE